MFILFTLGYLLVDVPQFAYKMLLFLTIDWWCYGVWVIGETIRFCYRVFWAGDLILKIGDGSFCVVSEFCWVVGIIGGVTRDIFTF